MKIVESVSGVWFYHLSEDGKTALCGEKRIMNTELRLKSWGFRGHLKEKYCTQCNNEFTNSRQQVGS